MQVLSYFGAKFREAHRYDRPMYSTIIEPFAGSAGYSQLHWENDVHLYDVDKNIVAAWRYLIEASPSDIRSLPQTLEKGFDIRTLGLSNGEREFVGFNISQGSNGPCNIVSRHHWQGLMRWLPDNISRFDHWTISPESYSVAPNVARATWFVDPPYVSAGNCYRHSTVDHSAIAAFARSRRGQTIVCENDSADWLPFRPLYANQSQHKASIKTELVWTGHRPD